MAAISANGGGIVTVDVVSGRNDSGQSVTVQTDGKILESGFSTNSNGSYSFALVRYNSNGSLDTSFGTGGKVTTAVGNGLGYDIGKSVTVQADGKILVGGSAFTNSNSNSNTDFALVRYNLNGSLDTSFGTGGKVTTDVSSISGGSSVTVQADGKILVGGAGSTYNSFALVRYNSNGSLDTSFGTGGELTAMIGNGRTAIIQTDSKILLVGTAGLARYNSNGSLDTSFGTGGIVSINTDIFGLSNSGIIQTDGKILTGGYITNSKSYDFALVRYNSNGSLDTSFGTDGKVTTDVSVNSYDLGQSVIVQADGKILAGGISYTGNTGSVALVRYNSNGSLDTSFGTGGKVTTVVDSSGHGVGKEVQNSGSVTVQADGKILVGGTDWNGSNYDFVIVRYNSDGSLDSSFNAAIDTTPPILNSLSPANNATGIAASANLVLTFSEAIQAGTGNFIIYNVNGAVAKTIAVTDTSQVSISGSTVTINPSADLASGTSYFVNAAVGVLKDLAGNNFAGIAGTAAYSFTTAANIITGTIGNDYLIGGGVGNESIDGGLGIDTVGYSSTLTSYNISKNASGFNISSATGSDSLVNIERLQFSDTKLAIDLDGNAGLTVKILGVVFGAASLSNKQYVGVGLSLLDGGMSYSDLIQLALNARLGSGFSNTAEVNLIYQNLAGFQPSITDLNYWTGLLSSGQFSQSSLAQMAADLSLNTTNINLIGLHLTGIEFV